jgi:hypothetical protein
LETVVIILRSATDKQATLMLAPTILGSNAGVDASPPLTHYMRHWNEPTQEGDGTFFPVCPNHHHI